MLASVNDFAAFNITGLTQYIVLLQSLQTPSV